MTLKDIAKISGCSISTVSKALNDSHEISKETKLRISKIVSKYNYKPNYYAANLKKKQHLILGVLLPNLKEDCYLNLLDEIIEETSRFGYRVMTYQSNNQASKEKTYIKLLSDDIIDGLIISPVEEVSYLSSDTFWKIQQNNYPIKFVFRKYINGDNSIDSGKTLVNDLIDEIKRGESKLMVS